jgi:hypothetical protein
VIPEKDGLYIVNADGAGRLTVAEKVGRYWKWLGTNDIGMEPCAVVSPLVLNSEDYGPDCEPLPVDEAFAKESGGERVRYGLNESFLWKPCNIAVEWFLSDGALFVNGHKIASEATRPQLRSLLAALGGGT